MHLMKVLAILKLNKMKLEIGKTYKNKKGRLIKITKGCEPLVDENGNLYKDGWNGIYWGDSVDEKKPIIDNERYEFNGKYWNYFSFHSFVRTKKKDNSFNIPEEDLIEEIL